MRLFGWTLFARDAREERHVECRRCGRTRADSGDPCPTCGSARTITYEVE